MKKTVGESVVQDWVGMLPFMQQALLMTAMRGPDGVSKFHDCKAIVRYMRGVVLKPAGEIIGNEDKFMWINYDKYHYCVQQFFHDTDDLPMHFLMHLVHAAQVVAYKHPDTKMRANWLFFYKQACESLHMIPEPSEQMEFRMKY